jgi:hypothetical protein
MCKMSERMAGAAEEVQMGRVTVGAFDRAVNLGMSA